jgi:hypothetical protein
MLRDEILPWFIVTAVVVGCGGETTGVARRLDVADAAADGSRSGSRGGGAGTSSGGSNSSGLVVCNDGTGNTDCCPPSAVGGSSCSYSGPTCWTKCSNGSRSQMSCSAGTWNAGHGLFPCTVDAGVEGGPCPSLTPPACRQGTQWNPATCACELGPCRPVIARSYDPKLDCYGLEEALPGLCLRETAPGTTSGAWEMACLVAADGTRYMAAKGYTECLEGYGWSTQNTNGVGPGWTVKGAGGLCLQGDTGDTLCGLAGTRGRWDFGDGGLGGDGHLILPAGDGGPYAGECR